jgi:hypothetical protein
VSASLVIAILVALGGAVVAAKTAGDWLEEWQGQRRERDRDADNLHGYTDGRGVRHPGVVERIDEVDEWRVEVDEWREDVDARLGDGGAAS